MKELKVERKTSSNLLESPSASRLALWGGIAFSMAFTGLIWWAGARLASIPHLPDLGPAWYYWRLATPTFWNTCSLHARSRSAGKRIPSSTPGMCRTPFSGDVALDAISPPYSSTRRQPSPCALE